MNFPAGFIFFVALTTLISAISFHLFEMPVNRLIRKTFGASR
jgi:peptidoglycan/LPS O-acetylase OafA/YrhL